MDNAAKIFPPTSSKRDPKVFRFACELHLPIQPPVLQQALEDTLELFPGYRCVLKRGLFWYYLEESDLVPQVEEESLPLCSPLYQQDIRSLLFRVFYYRNRINLEIYHALADGTGAMQFLRVLVCHYLAKIYFPQQNPPILPEFDASQTEQMADSFQKYYSTAKKQRDSTVRAFRIKGPRISENRIKATEGIVPVKALLDLARSYNTTVTVLLTSLLVCAIYSTMSVWDTGKPVVVAVPVNLRNYFSSVSVRNFFAVMGVKYKFPKGGSTLEEVIPVIGKEFQENLTRDKLEAHMNSFISIEKNPAARAAPLVVKDISMRIANDITIRRETAALSNVGKVDMPECYREHIRLFDVIASTERVQLCICSFGNNMTLTFSDPFRSQEIQKYFFRALVKLGIPVEVTASLQEEDMEKPKKTGDSPAKSPDLKKGRNDSGIL